MWNLKKKKTRCIYIQNRNILTDIENKHVTKGERINQEYGINKYKQLKQVSNKDLL